MSVSFGQRYRITAFQSKISGGDIGGRPSPQLNVAQIAALVKQFAAEPNLLHQNMPVLLTSRESDYRFAGVDGYLTDQIRPPAVSQPETVTLLTHEDAAAFRADRPKFNDYYVKLAMRYCEGWANHNPIDITP